MKKILIVISFLFVFQGNSLVSQWSILKSDADSLILLGADYIYNCQFTNAEETFKKVIKVYPDNPAGYFLDAMVEWWRISTYRNTEQYDNKFLFKIDRVVNLCNKLLETNPLDISALFFKGGALGYRGRFNVIRKSWFNAATDGYNAFDILLRCYQVAPNNHDIMLGTGIYNYFAQALPEEYPAIKPLIVFAPSGDKKLGVLQLKAAANMARYANIEAKVILLQLYYDFEKNYAEAFKIAEELNTKYPNNPMFHRYYGRCLVSNGRIDEYEKTWRDILKRYIDKQPGYDVSTAREALYYIGTSLLYKKNLDMALKYFYKADEASRKVDKEITGFMVQTNIKIAKIYETQNKTNLAIQQYQKILSWDDYRGSHAEATEAIKRLK
jgi:tetratricopeptide (TPR) repeat protein